MDQPEFSCWITFSKGVEPTEVFIDRPASVLESGSKFMTTEGMSLEVKEVLQARAFLVDNTDPKDVRPYDPLDEPPPLRHNDDSEPELAA